MRILCVLGQHQYGDPKRGLGTEYSCFIPALKALNHDVIHFESWNKNAYKDFGELNQRLLKTVERVRPDVMLVVQTNYEIWLETLQVISSRGDTATVCWTTDDSWKYRQVSRIIGKYYHAMTTTYPTCVNRYHKDGIPNVLLSQWAANDQNLLEPIPASECRYLVSFVGSAHGNRKKKIRKLEKLGIKVACFGYGWKSGALSMQEIPKVIRDSIISINFSNSRGINQIKARTFEVPGNGGFLLTEWAPGLDNFYEDGKEIVVFHNINELAKRIRYFSQHFDERDAIARAGFERTRTEHTYTNRMRGVIDFAISAKAKWIPGKENYSLEPFDKVLRRHEVKPMLKMLRRFMIKLCGVFWGKERGPRAARRILFELGWRFWGSNVFRASGLPGRLFYKES